MQYVHPGKVPTDLPDMSASSDEPIRILHVVGGMNCGGVETWLMNVLRRIDREKFQMDFLVHTTKPCAYDDEIRSLGSRVIPCLHPSRPWKYARNFRRAVGENGGYDIVHSHVYLFSGFVLRIAHQMGIPGRIAHMYPPTDMRGGLVRPAYKWLMNALLHRHATHILACSQTTLEAVRRSHAGFHRNSSVVWLGIELEH